MLIFLVALTVTVLGGFDVLLLLNSVVERRKQQFCGVQVLQMVTFYFFFTCIIDWVCSIRTARSGGIYGACLSYLIALKLICIKSLTREQIYTYYIVLLGCFLFCSACSFQSVQYLFGCTRLEFFKIYPNIL